MGCCVQYNYSCLHDGRVNILNLFKLTIYATITKNSADAVEDSADADVLSSLNDKTEKPKTIGPIYGSAVPMITMLGNDSNVQFLDQVRKWKQDVLTF